MIKLAITLAIGFTSLFGQQDLKTYKKEVIRDINDFHIILEKIDPSSKFSKRMLINLIERTTSVEQLDLYTIVYLDKKQRIVNVLIEGM